MKVLLLAVAMAVLVPLAMSAADATNTSRPTAMAAAPLPSSTVTVSFVKGHKHPATTTRRRGIQLHPRASPVTVIEDIGSTSVSAAYKTLEKRKGGGRGGGRGKGKKGKKGSKVSGGGGE